MLNLNLVKYFYIDLDDTLLMTAKASALGLERAYHKLASECDEDLSVRLPMEAFMREMDKAYQENRHSEFEIGDFEGFCRKIPSPYSLSPKHTGDSLAARLFWNYKETKNKALMPFEGAFDLIAGLKKSEGVVFCITRGVCNYQFTKLMLSDLEDKFSAVLVVDMRKEGDSKAKQLKEHLDLNKIRPERAAIIGDSTEDIDAGQAAGIRTIRIRTERHKDDQSEKPADGEFASILELKRHLETRVLI